ncbi:MAG: helix-turn-helix domain-containing protein [Thermoplasmata archaeon]
MEVERQKCFIDETLFSKCCSIECLSLGPDRTIHKVVCKEGQEECVRKLLAGKDLKFKRAGKNVFWVESDSCVSCAFFARSFSNVMGSILQDKNKLQYKVLLPSIRGLKDLKEGMENAGLKYEIAEIRSYMHQELTDREREVLRKALQYGYFKESSRTSLTSLAEIIGISPSSLSAILRRSLRKVVNFYFDHKP